VYAIAVAAVAVTLANLLAHRQNLRAGSKVVGGAPVAVTSIPTSYTATFRVDNRAGKTYVTTEERYWVRRPFDSRIETWRGGKRLSVRYSSFGRLAQESPSAQPLNIAVPPALASGDLRVDASLEQALKDGTIVRREKRSVYGRVCQVYRAGGPVSAGDLTPYKPGTGEYADFCVDSHGIVLEEVWTSQYHVIRRRVITKLAIDPPIADDKFEISLPQSAANMQGFVGRFTPPAPLWRLRSAPAGFTSLGIFAVQVPSVAVPQQEGELPAAAPSSTTEVFVNGPDLLVVDQDPSLASYIASDSRPTRPANVRVLNGGQLVVDARMSEVRGGTPDGSAVRVFGTLSPQELLQLAGGMVKR
jgi:hypothetical protein